MGSLARQLLGRKDPQFAACTRVDSVDLAKRRIKAKQQEPCSPSSASPNVAPSPLLTSLAGEEAASGQSDTASQRDCGAAVEEAQDSMDPELAPVPSSQLLAAMSPRVDS